MDVFLTWLSTGFVDLCHWCARCMDPVLGWLLSLPYDVSVLFVGIGTSVLLTIARRLITNQDRLKRVKSDMARLNQLLKQAKHAKDKPAVTRIAQTIGMIQIVKMKAEMLGLAVAIIPILFLASWAFDRLDFIPPKVDEVFAVRATFPLAACDNNAWLMIDDAPAGALQVVRPQGKSYVPAQANCIQDIRIDDNKDPETGVVQSTDPINGLAEWHLKVNRPCDSAVLKIVYNNKAIDHPVKVGGWQYADQTLLHNEDPAKIPWQNCSSSVVMKRAMFLSEIPGVTPFWEWWQRTSLMAGPNRAPGMAGWWHLCVSWDGPKFLWWLVSRLTLFPPWLASYLIITIPFVPLLRRVGKVA